MAVNMTKGLAKLVNCRKLICQNRFERLMTERCTEKLHVSFVNCLDAWKMLLEFVYYFVGGAVVANDEFALTFIKLQANTFAQGFQIYHIIECRAPVSTKSSVIQIPLIKTRAKLTDDPLDPDTKR